MESLPHLKVEYQAVCQDAEKWKDKEVGSITHLQAVYRGWKTRCKLRRWDAGCRVIQRVFRGHLGRSKSLNLSSIKTKRQRIALFEYCASKIQKIFKGYFSRKYTHNFQARRAYVQKVVDASNEVNISCIPLPNITWTENHSYNTCYIATSSDAKSCYNVAC